MDIDKLLQGIHDIVNILDVMRQWEPEHSCYENYLQETLEHYDMKEKYISYREISDFIDQIKTSKNFNTYDY